MGCAGRFLEESGAEARLLAEALDVPRQNALTFYSASGRDRPGLLYYWRVSSRARDVDAEV